MVFSTRMARYILMDRSNAEIYNRSSDLFKPDARAAGYHPHRRRRGDYPEAIGAKRGGSPSGSPSFISPANAMSKSCRRPLHPDRGATDRGRRIIGLRVDITELKQREASFRLLFRQQSCFR